MAGRSVCLSPIARVISGYVVANDPRSFTQAGHMC